MVAVSSYFSEHTIACVLNIYLYLTPFGQGGQFIETCGTKKSHLLKVICLLLELICNFCPGSEKILHNINEYLTSRQYLPNALTCFPFSLHKSQMRLQSVSLNIVTSYKMVYLSQLWKSGQTMYRNTNTKLLLGSKISICSSQTTCTRTTNNLQYLIGKKHNIFQMN